MNDPVFSLLDAADMVVVEQYERALFRAFYPQRDTTLPLVWNIDRNNRRLCSLIPYTDQDIVICRMGDAVIAGVAVNYAIERPMQLEALGFTIDKTLPGTCEGRALFSTQVFAGMSPVLVGLGEYTYELLTRRGMRIIYGNCHARLLRGYRAIGFSEIDEKMVGTSRCYLLKKEIGAPTQEKTWSGLP